VAGKALACQQYSLASLLDRLIEPYLCHLRIFVAIRQTFLTKHMNDLRRRYEETPDAETRTRYQMLLLSTKGQTSTQIAQIVLRSQDTVVRVLKRFLTGGLEAVPRRTAPGRERTITQAWESELL
jgi:Winged helix-turn helix